MSNDTHSGNLLRSNLSGYILDQIDVNRKQFFDLKSAARDKTITRNRLFLEKDSENTYKKKLSQIEDTNKNSIKIKELKDQIVNLRGQLTQRVKEIEKKEDQISKLNDRLDNFTHSVLDTSSPKQPTATQIVRTVENQLQGQQAPPTAAQIAAAVENQIPTVTQIATAVRNQLQGQQAPLTAAQIAREVERQLQIPTAAQIATAVQNQLQIPNAAQIATAVQNQLQIPNAANIAGEVLRQLRPEIQGLPTVNQIVTAVENRLGPQLGRIPSIQEIRTELNSRLPPQFVSMPQIQNAIDKIPVAPKIGEIEDIIKRELPVNLQGQITSIVQEIENIIATQGIHHGNLKDLEKNILDRISNDTGLIIREVQRDIGEVRRDIGEVRSDIGKARDDIKEVYNLTRLIPEEIGNLTDKMMGVVKEVVQNIDEHKEVTKKLVEEVQEILPATKKLTEEQSVEMGRKIDKVIRKQKKYNKLNREDFDSQKQIVATIQQELRDITTNISRIPDEIEKNRTAITEAVKEVVKNIDDHKEVTENLVKKVDDHKEVTENLVKKVDDHKEVTEKLVKEVQEILPATKKLTEGQRDQLAEQIGKVFDKQSEYNQQNREDFNSQKLIVDTILRELRNIRTETDHITEAVRAVRADIGNQTLATQVIAGNIMRQINEILPIHLQLQKDQIVNGIREIIAGQRNNPNLEDIRNIVEPIINLIQEVRNKIRSDIQTETTAIQTQTNLVQQLHTNLPNMIKQTVQEVLGRALNAQNLSPQEIQEIANRVIQKINEVIPSALNVQTDEIMRFFKIQDEFNVNNLRDIQKNIEDYIEKKLNEGIATIKSDVGTLINTIKDEIPTMEDISKAVKDVITESIDTLQNNLEGKIQELEKQNKSRHDRTTRWNQSRNLLTLKQIAELRRQLGTVGKNRVKFHKEIMDKLKELGEENTTNTTNITKNTDKNIEALQKEIRDMKKEIKEDFGKKFEKLEGELKELVNSTQAEHIKVIKSSDGHLISIKTSISKLKERIDRYYNIQKELKGSFDEQIAGINESNSVIKRQNEELSKAIQEIQLLKTQTGETGERYKESLEELRIIKENLNTNVGKFHDQIERMGNRISELSGMEERYKQNLTDMLAGMAEFREQIGVIQSEIPSESELSFPISISSDNDSEEEPENQYLEPTTNRDEVINALQQMSDNLKELFEKIQTTNDGITKFTEEMKIIKEIVTENKTLNNDIKNIVTDNSANIKQIMNKLNIGNSEELIVNENINIRLDIGETIDEIIGKIIADPNSISSEDIENLRTYSNKLTELIIKYQKLYEDHRQLYEDNRQMLDKNNDLETKNTELKEQLAECQKKLKECLERENVNLPTDNQKLLDNCLKELKDLRNQLQLEIEDLKKQLQECHKKNESLEIKLQECKNPTHDDEKNIEQDQDSLNIDSQIIGVPPESDLLHMLLKKYKTFANFDDLPANPSQEELEKLKKDHIKHIDNVTDALMIKLNILKMLIPHITDARELSHAMALLADLENLINGNENSNSLEENKKMRLNNLKIVREAHESSKNMINGLNKHKERMEKGRQQREKSGEKYETTKVWSKTSVTEKIGGRTIGDELYEDIGFINSEIIKLPAKKNNFKQKKINRIVNNLFNNINKKKTKVKNSVIRVQKGGVVNLGHIRTMRDKYFDFVRLDKILEKFIGGMKKKYDQYQIFKQNENYEASKEPMTPEYKQAKAKRSISIGELKNYYTIMKSIINVWEKIGLWEDKIFSKPTQENKDLFNKILSDLNEIYEKKEKTRMRDIRDNLVDTNNERFKYLSEIDDINLDIEQNFDEKNDSVNKGRFSGIFPYIETDEQIDEEIIEEGIKVGYKKVLRWKAILKLSLKIYKEAYIPMIKWSNCFELVTQDDTIPSTFIIPLTVVESFDTWNKKYTKIEEPWEDKKFFSTVYTKQKEVVSEFPYFLYLTLLLDKWQILTRKPISLFARINDMGRSKVPIELAKMDRSEMYNRPDSSERDKRNNPKQSFDESQKSCLKFKDKHLFDTEDAWTLAHQEVSFKNFPSQKYANRYKNQFGINQEKFDPTLSMDFQEDINICDKVLPYDYIQWYETDPKITKGQESGYLAIDIKQCEKIGKDEDEDVELKIIADPGKMVKFQEVFWRPEFDNNKNISSYMLLDKLIPNRIGTYLVTYGYSGVGKSYTLFGADKSEGLLQATVGNISTNNTFVGLKLRVYELYGMGMCYSDCWNNYNSIDQVVYHYNIDPRIGAISDGLALSLADSPKIISRRGKQIPQYIKGIHKYATEPEFDVGGNSYKYFTKFPSDRKSRTTVLQNFTKFIKNIEADRKNPSNKYPKRVNETVNNPDSSRAKLVYDFLFEFENKYTDKNGDPIREKYECPLIIDDTPGAENLLESYILKNTDIMFFDKMSDKKQKKQKKIEISEDSTESDYCMINNTGPGENYIKWQECLLNSILLNPLFCGIFNSAGILTAFNILLNGEGVYDLEETNIKNAYYKYVYPQERKPKSIYEAKVRRTSELFTEFYNFLKGETIEDINLTKYVDMYKEIEDSKGFKFKLLEARQESYSKQYSGTYENKVFSNFFDTKTFKDEYKTARDNVLKDTSQIRPIFLNSKNKITAEQKQQKEEEMYQYFYENASYKTKSSKYKGKGVRVDEEDKTVLVGTDDVDEMKSNLEVVKMIKEAKEYKIDITSKKILNYFTETAQTEFKNLVGSVKLVKKRKNVDTKEIEEKTMRLAVWLILKLIVFCSEREKGKNLNTNEMKYDLLISLLSYSADMTGIFWIKKLMGERKIDDTNKSLSCRSIYESFDKNTQDSLIEKFNQILKKSSQDSDNNFGSLEELYMDYWNSIRIHRSGKIEKENINKYWEYKEKEKRVGWTGQKTSKTYYSSKYSFEIIKKHLPIPTKEIRNNLIKDIKSGGGSTSNRPDGFWDQTVTFNKTVESAEAEPKPKPKPLTREQRRKLKRKEEKRKAAAKRKQKAKELERLKNERKAAEREKKFEEIRRANQKKAEKDTRKKYLTNFINFLKDYAEDEKKKKKHPGKPSIKDVVDSKGFWEEILFDLKKGEQVENFKSRFTSESLKNRCLDEIMSLNDKFFTDKRFKYYSREVFKRYITLSMESWYINQNISGILKKCSEISGLDYSAITGGDVDNNDKVTPWQYKYASQENIGKLIYKDKNFQLEKIPSSTDETICKMYNLSINTTDINKTSYVGNLKTIEEYIDKIKKGDYNNMHSNVTNYLQGLYKPEPLFPIKKFPQEIEDSNKQVIIDNEIGDKENLKDKDLKKWQKKKIDTAIGVLMDPYVNKPDDSKINISDYKMFYVLSNNDTQLKCYDQLKTFGQFSKFISNMPK